MEEWNDKNPFYVSHGGFFKKPEVLKPGSCLKPGGFFSKAEFLKKDGRSCAKHGGFFSKAQMTPNATPNTTPVVGVTMPDPKVIDKLLQQQLEKL